MSDVGLYARALSATEVAWLALCKDLQVSGFVCTANLGAMGRHNYYPVGQMHSVAGVVQDADGNIWVSEFGTPRITKFNYEGTVLDVIGGQHDTAEGQVWGPWGLAVDASNNLYVCDSQNHRVQKFDSNGNHLFTFGTLGTDVGQFQQPTFLEVAGDYFYVSDEINHNLQRFRTDGTEAVRIGEAYSNEEFTSTGLDDMDLYYKDVFLYSGTTVRDYIVEITTTGAIDKFRYSDDGRLTWSAEKAITDIQPGRPQYVHDLSHNIEIKFVNATGHTGSEEWTFTRKPSQLYNPHDIAVDGSGDLWVIDKGAEGDRSCIKKFAPNGTFYAVNFYRDYGPPPADPAIHSHGLAYHNGYLYVGNGELSGDDSYFHKIHPATGTDVLHWGKEGSGPSEHLSGQQCAIAQHDSQLTLLGTDWFVCKVTEWDLSGKWLRTIQSSLRSDAYCIKSKNPTAGAEPLYQRVNLPEGHYTVQFLAFTNGDGLDDDPPVTTICDHVVPYAGKVPEGGGEPENNQIQALDMAYEAYLLTRVEHADYTNRYAWFITGQFTVGSGESGQWDVGAEVQGKPAGEDARRVYIASLTCFKTGDLQ